MEKPNDSGSSSRKPSKSPSKMEYDKAIEIVKNYKKRSLLEKTITKDAFSMPKFPDHQQEIPCVKPFVENNFPPALFRTPKVPSIEPNDVTKLLPAAFVIQKKLEVNQKNENHSPVVEEDLRRVPVDIDLDVADPPVTIHGNANHSVVVCSQTPGDVGVLYDIHSNETFENIYSDYAKKINVLPREIWLKKWSDDRLILRTDKPGDVDLKSCDDIYVMGQPSVLNLNSRVKYFYITEVARDPITVKVSGTMETRLVGLFHRWAERADADPSKVVFMHEWRYLTTVDTGGSAGLHNGDEVVAFYNCP